MKSIREQLEGKCQHYTSWNHNDASAKCDAGVNYYELMKMKEIGKSGCMLRIPCYGNKIGSIIRGETVENCDKYLPYTEEQIQEQIDEIEQVENCLMDNVSSCCEAPIDESKVITEGHYKGHGPRYCSKCKRCVYVV